MVISRWSQQHVAFETRASALPIRFAHLAEHRMPDGRILIDSYHCSRYNQNTGRLTDDMFDAVFARALQLR